MQIQHREHNSTYVIVNNNQDILVANSIEELYSKALELMQVFSQPVTSSVPSLSETQRALDILTSKG